jgi:hypothetical protein
MPKFNQRIWVTRGDKQPEIKETEWEINGREIIFRDKLFDRISKTWKNSGGSGRLFEQDFCKRYTVLAEDVRFIQNNSKKGRMGRGNLENSQRKDLKKSRKKKGRLGHVAMGPQQQVNTGSVRERPPHSSLLDLTKYKFWEGKCPEEVLFERIVFLECL